MSSRHVFDELSTYIDGESNDSQRIARHLQSCSDCAQRHMELLRLSNHLRAMSPPEVNAAFTARVLAGLDANSQAKGWHLPIAPRPILAVALAASLVILGVGAVFMGGQERTTPLNYPNVASETLLEDGAVILAFGKLLEAGAWGDQILSDESGEDLVLPPTADALIDILAAWTLEEASVSWYETDDLFSVMEALALEDVGVLDELTRELWDEV